MLVLTRKVGEKIQIGDGVTVTVVRISAGAIRLGVEAPTGVAILRDDAKVDAESSANCVAGE
jgi:carbon storage regulator